MREDQQSITAWAVKTFGEPEDAGVIMDKLEEEFDELLSEDGDLENAPGEAADLLIVLFQLSEFLGFDLMDAVDEKMQINRARKWTTDGKGSGHHIPEDN